MIIKNTSLCYIESENKYLMLHRIKKVNDENRDKWIGIGGKFAEGESPYDCVLRECQEETGLVLNKALYRGIVTFVSDIYESEQMHLFTCKDYSGMLIECDEGKLEWVEKDKISSLNLWQGDLIFLDLLEKRETFFSLKLEYKGDRLNTAVLDGETKIYG